MEYFKLFISFISVLLTNAITPTTICEIDHPFRKSDLNCDNFENICIKKDDENCKTLRSACRQCPPTNYTIIMYQDVMKMKGQLNSSIIKFDQLKEEISHMFNRLKDAEMSETQKYTGFIRPTFITIIILLLLIFATLILEIRFKLMTRLFNINSNSRGYDLLQSRKFLQIKNEINDQLSSLKNEINEQLDNLKDEMKATQNVKIDSCKMKFQIPKKMINLEFNIQVNDNAVKLKRQIFDRIEGIGLNGYKTIKMKYKGNELDNNQYLLSCIDSPEIPIYCEVDNDDNNIININEIIILKLLANFPVPDMLEIKLSQTIGQLKGIISQITQLRIEDLIIMRQWKELDNNKTVGQCGLSDNDLIQVINITNGTVLIQSIFNDNIQYKFQYCSTDKVLSLKEKLAEELKCDANKLSLFTNDIYLSQNDYLYKYYLSGELLIKYFNITDQNNYEKDKLVLFCDRHAVKYFKTNELNKEERLVKTYETSIFVKDGNTIDFISDNILLFMKTKSHPRFVQLFSVCLSNNKIYLEIENVHGEFLNRFIEIQKEVKEYKIAKWTNQILEGLAYIHQYGFVYKDLTPFDIFIDGYHNVKLPSFNWKSSFDGPSVEHFHRQVTKSILKYVSPEILGKKPFGVKADVWSLGMTLISIVTNEDPYPKKGDIEMAKMIISDPKVEYKKDKMSKELIEFIDLCLIGDMNKRASIDQLLQTEFIRKYE